MKVAPQITADEIRDRVRSESFGGLPVRTDCYGVVTLASFQVGEIMVCQERLRPRSHTWVNRYVVNMNDELEDGSSTTGKFDTYDEAVALAFGTIKDATQNG